MNEITKVRQELESGTAAPFDVYEIRKDFPILSRTVYDKPLVYLDSAASAQKPRQVIDAMVSCMTEEYSNVHRGLHWLSATATTRFETARKTVQRFINAREDREIIFTRSATEAINLVAASWGRTNLREGDEIIVSQMEHHANIVPWQMLRTEKGIVLKVVPIDESGTLLMDEYEKLLGPKTKLVAITHMSNALGTINPVKDIVRLAHDRGVPVLLDGCQGITHLGTDVQDLDVRFLRLLRPQAVRPDRRRRALRQGGDPGRHAALPGRRRHDRPRDFEETTFKGLPHRFEAGTPAIVEVIGLGAALEYLMGLGLDRIAAHERDVLTYATELLSEIPGVRIYGTSPHKASILSFTLEGAHPHDVGTIIDRAGVAVRAGHHCAQPLMDFYNVAATARASFGLYNTREEAEALASALRRVKEIFG